MSNSLQIFYTLPSSIAEPPYLQWYTEPRLRRYTLALVADSPVAVATVAEILVRQLHQLPIDRRAYTHQDLVISGCMTAFLSHILLAKQASRWIKFELMSMLEAHGSLMELADIYAIALELLSDSGAFLRKYEPGLVGCYENLCAYSFGKFRRATIDRLRNIPELKHFARTNLGLLVRGSRLRVKKALIEAGEGEERLLGLLLLVDCLQETVKAREFDTKDPQPVHYAALLARYRTRGAKLDLAIVDLDCLTQLLVMMGNALRNYELPKTTSLDLPVGNDFGDRTTTLGDLVAAPTLESDDVMEIQSQTQQSQQQVIKLLQQLSPAEEQVLFLLYGLQLTQVKASETLGINQSTIKRQRDRILAKLAKQLHTHLSPSTQNLTTENIALHTTYITLICQDYYAHRKTEL